jgi:hypothetical protein
MNLPARVIAASAFSGAVPATDLASALRAIEHRNEVVHEGAPFRDALPNQAD